MQPGDLGTMAVIALIVFWFIKPLIKWLLMKWSIKSKGDE